MEIEWFQIKVDDEKFSLNVSPPGMEHWNVDISWNQIIRICYKTSEFIEPDDIYIFVDYRPESYVIPSTGVGASELWMKIIDKGLFDPKLAIHLMSTSGEIGCHPSE